VGDAGGGWERRGLCRRLEEGEVAAIEIQESGRQSGKLLVCLVHPHPSSSIKRKKEHPTDC
jgi:hypothetical protein